MLSFANEPYGIVVQQELRYKGKANLQKQCTFDGSGNQGTNLVEYWHCHAPRNQATRA